MTQVDGAETAPRGALASIRVIELAGLGAAPFAAMMLADMGADVIRIDRKSPVPGDEAARSSDLLNRGRRSVGVELKNPAGVGLVLRLAEGADVLIEGFRPGVMERLGLGPEACLARNPRLVYGRMTGFGQTGPLAQAAGHDIDYIALSGALEPLGRAGDRPVPPMNLLGDFGGGAMFLVAGVLAALVERATSQRGQVVDAAMVDGSALLCTMLHDFRQRGLWNAGRGGNLLDTGAPFYEVYETQDNKFVAIGALEPHFYRELLERMGLREDPRFSAQMDQRRWPAMKLAFAEIFAQKTRAQWQALLEGGDSCFAPVLSPDEAALHPHNQARGTFAEIAGRGVPAPAPRFSRTPSSLASPPPQVGAHPDEALRAWGCADSEILALREAQAIA
ncbi:MAG TPA: CaiB/BaiF CoA-transferase family protein [Polyangia bacterium]|jgi:alpha-methylacyl-CoA racemase|nr:CaiB/BaiF CoA-transferase family protein [Polyangia bacterium]